MLKKIILFICLIPLKSFSQMTINDTLTSQQLVDLLVNPSSNIIISNVSMISSSNFDLKNTFISP